MEDVIGYGIPSLKRNRKDEAPPSPSALLAGLSSRLHNFAKVLCPPYSAPLEAR
jgi:hypothetical protein